MIAAVATEQAPDLTVRLVESDGRKATFLRTVARETGLSVDVIDSRIEALAPQSADILTARALAPLASLLDYTEKHRVAGGISLFPKGQTVHKEIADARRRWSFEHKVHPSSTDSRAAILEIGAIERV